ncbi:histidine kinase [Paenibacillus sp. CF384]|uniref:sensor histidine kinase n=1 Tax=Paenibacillus sp. CF384 TaxID=1884382 RepID=UPI00089D57F3|nr:histidine kinase [Paenibacillus sp. CF384]SDW77122.1 two-component system, sensor histidine kinase YesM [Paenibacillus sp. CF384]
MPQVKSNIFTKLLTMLLLLLFPIVVLYGYSTNTSVGVIKSQIQELNVNRLAFFRDQIEEEMNQLVLLSSVISRDYSVQSLQTKSDYSSYAEISSVIAVENKLRLQQIAGKWSNQIIVYYPQAERVVPDSLSSVNPLQLANLDLWNKYPWIYENDPSVRGNYRFAHYVIDPFGADLESAQQVTKIYFSAEILKDLLYNFNVNKEGETFLWSRQFEPITKPVKPLEHKDELQATLRQTLDGPVQNKIVKVGGTEYVMNALQIGGLDWYIVDVVPIKQILKPITTNRNLFYIAIVVLVLIGTLASLWLYRYIQIPMRQLLLGVRKVRHGDYSIRIPERGNNDFDYLLSGFNHMTADIQVLIDQVYKEQIHSREAKLKQLQSQINPHFLYNCLFYIMNMSSLGDEEAVTAMALNLGEYFRYTTRNDKPSATLREETNLITNYLKIQQLRMKRLSYDISIPEEMMFLEIPRLSLQPIVENAAIHGIEPLPEGGTITVTGGSNGQEHWIVIENNGATMAEDKLRDLIAMLGQEHEEERGYGVWNMHQRFLLQFGEGSGLVIDKRSGGGMIFTIRWHTAKRDVLPQQEKEA